MSCNWLSRSPQDLLLYHHLERIFNTQGILRPLTLCPSNPLLSRLRRLICSINMYSPQRVLRMRNRGSNWALLCAHHVPGSHVSHYPCDVGLWLLPRPYLRLLSRSPAASVPTQS